MNEYKKLTGNESKYIAIPSSIILDKNIDYRRVVVYIYFAIKKGLDNEIDFTINSLVNWCGYTPNNNKGKINEKIKEIIVAFDNGGFINLDEMPKEKKYKNEYVKDYYTAMFNEDVVVDELCNPSRRFALLWIDEIKKIMSYKIEDTKNVYLNSSTLLLVFSYLRMVIYRRSSLNISYTRHKEEAKNNPEAYNGFYYKIADEIGISSKTLSKALNILSNDLQLIYIRELPKIKYENKYRTDNTIFCNTYKREGCYLIAYGKDYYEYEVENKINKLKKFNTDKYRLT